MPEDITVPTDPGEVTAVVTWTPPSASDNGGTPGLTSDHAPGDTCPLGATSVTCTATDDAGLQTRASFTDSVIRRDYVAGDTQVTASPDRILADGSDQSLITVTLYDNVGYRLGYGGATVVLATNLGQLGPVSDLGDGRYTATLTAGVLSGEADISVLLDGAPITGTRVSLEVDTAFVAAEVTERTRAFSQRRPSRTFATQPGSLGLDSRRALAMLALYGSTNWHALTLTPQLALAWGHPPSGALDLGMRSKGFGPWSGEISLGADGLGEDSYAARPLRLSAERRFRGQGPLAGTKSAARQPVRGPFAPNRSADVRPPGRPWPRRPLVSAIRAWPPPCHQSALPLRGWGAATRTCPDRLTTRTAGASPVVTEASRRRSRRGGKR